ncbi:fatty acid synthase beta subunit [Penicillium cf. viridicatum]|uniref:Fatty acid synthase beta subunit n=1 Tax=Penicillium cf. viridicatum TaxID=2972119 RepID=A0A9W9M8T6_9EURO|nr:fatty acid synthase beta subunit [Penicillium cf. viridicatum]
MESTTSTLPHWRIDIPNDLLHTLRACLSQFGQNVATPELGNLHPKDDYCIPLTEVASFLDRLHQAQVDDDLITALGESFRRYLLSTTDIHTLSTRLDRTSRDRLLEAYFRILKGPPQETSSGLLSSAKYGNSSLLAVFGGQGTHNSTGLDELRSVYRNYKPLLEDLITSAAQVLKKITISSDLSRNFGPNGFDLMLWLEKSENAPNSAFLATAPVSFPMNGLISLVHYCVTCRVLDFQPGEFRDILAGATGHSQGIVVAAIVAGSKTWADFLNAVEDAMELLFWLGWESHCGTPSSTSSKSSRSIGDTHLNFATSMLSVRGMKKQAVEKILEECNAHLGDDEKAYLGLVNSSDSMVISGPERTLNGVRSILERTGAPSDSNQDKIMYLDRRPSVDCQFLPISAAFHSPHLDSAYRRIIARIGSAGLFDGLDFTIPVYHTFSGEDVHLNLGQDRIAILVRAVLCEPVDWPKACMEAFTTHILDFGPGRTSTFLHDQIIGSGRRIIIASESMASSHSVGGKHEIFRSQPPIMNPSWVKLYSPTLLSDEANGTRLVTRMSQILGTPPIMVAGMTPTTVSTDFVSCVMNAGYHIELACGGYSRPQDLELAIKQLSSTVPRGRGITLNVIYAAPRAISWQIPLIRRLRSEGHPIEGLCVGAGVPSPEVAKEYIDTLRLKHISLKPSSVNSIMQVLEIAKTNPSVPVLLQWTGGRAGGHHSYDDLYEPLVKTYGSIRKHANVILVVGSGLGDAQGMMPLLTGEWAESRGYPRMPVDGILIGSRMMVAKEASTSTSVKNLIVQTPGVDNSEWHKTYDGPAGGVITVRSEMGEPIHKIANRAVILWHDMDNTLFNVKDADKRVQLLQSRRLEIITRLNQDYAKPWFAMNFSGKPVRLEDMTYAECLQRITTLMYMHQQQEWVHESYQVFFLDFVNRVQERFDVEHELPLDASTSPFDLLEKLFTVCPAAIADILYPEDAAFFLGLCKRRGQKPVNFIPILDADFEMWFKKDSLWQMEKLEAVVDQDPQRVCIIHGPVAAKFSTSIDEPAADILNKIHDDLIEAVRLTVPNRDLVDLEEVKVQTEIRANPFSVELDFVDLVTSKTQWGTQVDCRFKQPLPSSGTLLFLQKLGIGGEHWLSVCLNDETVLVGHHRRPNRVHGAFQPGPGDRLTIEYLPSNKQSLNAAFLLNLPGQPDNRAAFTLGSTDGNAIRFDLRGPNHLSSMVTLNLQLQCKAGQQSLHDITNPQEANIREFYASCWSFDGEDVKEDAISTEFSTGPFMLSSQLVSDFISLISKAKGNHSGSHSTPTLAPLDLAIVVAWKALSRPLLVPDLGGDLSRLLHLSNAFEMMPGAEPLQVGDYLETKSHITAVTMKPQGKLVEVTAAIHRKGAVVVKITSEFLMQGQFAQQDQNFRFSRPNDWNLSLDSPKLVALLQSRQWFNPDPACPELLGNVLLFRVTSHRAYSQSTNMFSLNTRGTVSLVSKEGSGACVGNVSFSHESCSGNPVVDFLERYGSSTREIQPLEHPGWHKVEPLLLRVCDFGPEYSTLSTDHNPIHVSSCFAGFSGLSAPIVHGMYTSAVVRSRVEEHIAGLNCSGFRRWSTTFEDVVRGNDVLRIEIHHKGMIAGNMILDVQVWNDKTNTKVLTAEAEVEQARTAYMFCGQGSQKKDMGMALYEADDSAKSIWDRGDRYLFNLYGFSLLDIVRNNPKRITIHFGTKKGRQIRANYLALTRTQVIGNQEVTVPVIGGLSDKSPSITFEEPNGLLFSTQFAQPLISLLNVAEMAALKSRGLVQEGSAFAGHSLGEYSALLACANFMTLEGLLGLTFYRGLVMQFQMSQDAAGRTDFGMAAVNPSRVRDGFDEPSLKILVEAIGRATGLLLEVVNYNVAGQQYVCAGHLRSLWLLQKTCDDLSSSAQRQSPTREEIQMVIDRHLANATALPEPIQLQRGRATIPLPGVNVPFHSSYLRGGIPVYRRYLQSKIRKEDIVVDRLVGKYIPNLTGKPFSISRDYVEEVAMATDSHVLSQLLVDWM